MLGLEGVIHVIPNGTFGLPPRPAARRAETPTITCVGRLVPHKQVEHAIDAWDVLRHRISLTYEAEAEEKTSETVIQKIFDELPVP